MASYATPGIFPYVNYNGNTLIAGSELKNLDIAGAVEQCRQLTGGDMSGVAIDIVMFSSKTWSVDITGFNALRMLLITLSLNTYRSTLYDIQKAQWDYPDINFRYVVSPTGTLPTSTVPLGYSQSEIQTMINQGIADAKAALSAGVGSTWQEFSQFSADYLNSTFGTGATLDKTQAHEDMVNMLRQAFEEEAAAAASSSSSQVEEDDM